MIELDSRSSETFDVLLLWEPLNDDVWVEVLHGPTGEHFAIATSHERSRDAFLHPFEHVLSCLQGR